MSERGRILQNDLVRMVGYLNSDAVKSQGVDQITLLLLAACSCAFVNDVPDYVLFSMLANISSKFDPHEVTVQ